MTFIRIAVLCTFLIGNAANAAVTSKDLCANKANPVTHIAPVASWYDTASVYRVYLKCDLPTPALLAEAVAWDRVTDTDVLHGPVPVTAKYDPSNTRLTVSFVLLKKWEATLNFVIEEVKIEKEETDESGAPITRVIDYGKKVLFLRDRLSGFDPDSSTLIADGIDLGVSDVLFNGDLFFPASVRLDNVTAGDDELVFGKQLPYDEVLGAIAKP